MVSAWCMSTSNHVSRQNYCPMHMRKGGGGSMVNLDLDRDVRLLEYSTLGFADRWADLMAQGEYKKRSDKFATQRKSKSSKKSKPLGPRKGGMQTR